MDRDCDTIEYVARDTNTSWHKSNSQRHRPLPTRLVLVPASANASDTSIHVIASPVSKLRVSRAVQHTASEIAKKSNPTVT